MQYHLEYDRNLDKLFPTNRQIPIPKSEQQRFISRGVRSLNSGLKEKFCIITSLGASNIILSIVINLYFIINQYVSCSFSWYLYGYEDALEVLFIHMVDEILGFDMFEVSHVMNFIMMVKKTYRTIPYHNFHHGFNVTHCMYNILLRNKDAFTYLEVRN